MPNQYASLDPPIDITIRSLPNNDVNFQQAHALAGEATLLDTRHLDSDDILSLFEKAGQFQRSGYERAATPKLVCCLFFEPSTRTRMSFQAATYRLGHQLMTMDLGATSSLSKGETHTDTLLNVTAMRPDLLVVRYGDLPEFDQLLPTLSMPVISAGTGVTAHPTQALLDAYTIWTERKKRFEGCRVLIVGDVRHSRVAKSNFDVLSKLGAEVGVCGPETFLPAPGDHSNVRVFSDLDEAIGWAEVYMGLRIQFERHDAAGLNLDTDPNKQADYHRRFGLNSERLQKLADEALILHPGPINWGIEFSPEVANDPRYRVLQQVSNGVLVRAALIERFLESGEE